jgi:hypothetical protein
MQVRRWAESRCGGAVIGLQRYRFTPEALLPLGLGRRGSPQAPHAVPWAWRGDQWFDEEAGLKPSHGRSGRARRRSRRNV